MAVVVAAVLVDDGDVDGTVRAAGQCSGGGVGGSWFVQAGGDAALQT